MTYQQFWEFTPEEWKQYFCHTLDAMCNRTGETKYLMKDGFGNFSTIGVVVDESISKNRDNLLDAVKFLDFITDEPINCCDWFFNNTCCRYFEIPNNDDLKEVVDILKI